MNRRQFFKKAGVGLVGVVAIPFVPWESLRKGWVAIGRLGNKTVIRHGFPPLKMQIINSKTTIRTGLSTATWPTLYRNIQPRQKRG